MKSQYMLLAILMAGLCFQTPAVFAQPEASTSNEVAPAESSSSAPMTLDDVTEQVKEKSKEAADFATKKTEEIAEQVDKNPQAQEYSAGILQPIYAMAEYLSFSAFHWVAFALMISGVVSFVLQLVLAKLAVLAHGGFSMKQILIDGQGLLISLVGLFLTTQAATENSMFTNSPAAVLSSTVVGSFFGIVFYLWGQSEEIEAVRHRKALQAEEKKKKKK